MSDTQPFTLTEKDWENATPEQRGWYTYNAILVLSNRLNALEKREWIYRGCSFLGGVIGGFAAAIGVKLS